MTISEYNRCVDDYSDGVYRFVVKNLRDEEKARDIVQDSFEKMWVRSSEISYEKAKSYLFTTAYHTMIDCIRRDTRQVGLDASHTLALSVENSFTDLKEILEEAVSHLPEIQRSVLMLRDYEGYSYEDIGKITQLNESQVKVYIFRARTFLKNYIGSMEAVI